ncbi:MAG: hypothetical protein P4L50_18170 [Anaerolineaceae bacterium]|nr:hypothetical protein [Anaerolineaceae bacterium]
MEKTRLHKPILFLLALVITTACLFSPLNVVNPNPAPVAPAATIPAISPTLAFVTETPVPAALSTPTVTPMLSGLTAEPNKTVTAANEPSVDADLAYIQGNSLMVAHISGSQLNNQTEVTKIPPGEQVMRLGWSPSAEFLVYSLISSDNNPHIFLVAVKSASQPLDLGIADLGNGNNWAWSPDSKSLAILHEYDVWLYSPASGKKKQLTTHLDWNWIWSLPVFTPDGKAIWAVGTNMQKMDLHGTTTYGIYQIPIDGSGTQQYAPGKLSRITADLNGELPLDLRFSPDGKAVALIQASYIDICAKSTNYQVSSPDGKNFQDLPIPSLVKGLGTDQKNYFYGDSLAWDNQSGGFWVNGSVRDCIFQKPIEGGSQISHLTLDGQEHEIIPGDYSYLSLDHSASVLSVVNAKDGPRVQILGKDGHLLLDLGQGDLAVFNP